MATFTRLLRFLRPYRKGVIASGLLALLAMGATVVIPALTGAAIDAIREEDRPQLVWLAVAVAGAGGLRLAPPTTPPPRAGPGSPGGEDGPRGRMFPPPLAQEV